jgi:type IV pilus assembly protein PilP
MINHHRLVKLFGTTASLLVLVSLSACVSRDISDLESKVDNIMARPGGLIEPLPEIKPYEAYAYKASNEGGRNPFKLFYIVKAPSLDDEKVIDDGLTEEMAREIRNRNREELEQFELDSLRMVGTIDNENENWGIILDPNGIVHRIKVGNYIGLNIGKIINIYEDRVELREIVQDSEGRWEEREAALALLEE